MGFFSWKTQDTHDSIQNIYSDMPTFPVQMHDNQGNIWEENRYDGYGVFGGKDYYELLAEMNGLEGRSEGIGLAFSDPPVAHLSPNLTRGYPTRLFLSWRYRSWPPQECDDQGFTVIEEEE